MNKINVENVILVYIELPDSNPEQDIYELKELISTAQGEIILTATQKRNHLDANTVVGKGKLEEIKNSIELSDAKVDVVIFSCQLNSTQRETLRKTLNCDVIDKFDLILDIFAMRATSAEGKKQVELAQLSYNLATKPEGDFSRQGAGIGTRGPGETKLETNKRAARNKIYRLQQELNEIAKHRELTRKKREINDIFTVALVGYTNAGKSTLFNRLTKSNVYADNKLFATLDTTIRKLALPNNIEILLCDTVGFINDLPHTLLNAFKSTLEEAVRADLILNVCDASDINLNNHISVTEATLNELHVNAPIIRVFNKCDKLDETNTLSDALLSGNTFSSLFVSALTGKNLDVLVDKICYYATELYSSVKMNVPIAELPRFLAMINKYSSKSSIQYNDDRAIIRSTMPKKFINLFAEYLEI